MIKDVEECVLRTCLAHKILNVIDDECVDALIKADEFVDLAVVCSYGILALKQSGAYVKHTCLGIAFQNLDTDGLDEMGLPHSGWSEYEQRVECLAMRIFPDSFADCAGYLVASGAAIIFKSVPGVQLRVKFSLYLSLEHPRRH